MKFVKDYAIFIVLILLVLFFSIASEHFLTTSNIMNVLRQVSMIGIVAIGMTFLMIAGGIDLSVGSQISLVGMVTAWLMVHGGVSPVVAVLLGVATAVVVGLFNAFLTTSIKIHPLMITLGTMTIAAGLSKMISNGMTIYGFPEGFSYLGQGYVGIVPVPVIILAVTAILASFILNKTYFGRYVYAIGGNEEAARLSGIHIKRMKFAMFSICSFFTGIAGVVLLSRTNSGQPNAGAGFEFDVLTACVLGGISIMGGQGRISGVLTGVLIIGVLSNGLVLLNVGDFSQSIIKGSVLLGALALDNYQHKGKRKKRKAQAEVQVSSSSVS